MLLINPQFFIADFLETLCLDLLCFDTYHPRQRFFMIDFLCLEITTDSLRCRMFKAQVLTMKKSIFIDKMLMFIILILSIAHCYDTHNLE